MGIMLRFEYCVELEKGYTPVMQTEEEKEVRIVIEAMNRVTADRAVKALLKDAPNVKSYSRFCISCDAENCEER